MCFFGMVLALLSKWQRSSKEWIWFLPSIQFCSWFSSDFQIINLNPRWSQEVGIMQIQTSPPPPIPVNFLVPSLPPLSSSPPPPPPPSRWYNSSTCYSMHCPRSSHPPLHPSHSSQLNPGVSQSHSFFELSWSMISYPPSLPSHNYLSTSFLTHLPHPQQPGGDSFLPLSMVGRHQAGRWQKQVIF